MDSAIEVDQLRKSFPNKVVLDGVSLSVAAGGVFCLLGPNGAGKTTAVRILATLAAADGGRVRVAGFDVTQQRSEVRHRISLTGQYAALDELQTGTENLRMMARLRGLSRAEGRQRAAELLDRFDLVEAGGRRVSTYSGGMRRRLDLAASLVGRPEVVFLDEPTTGLDPRSRQAMWDVVAELTTDGVSVLLTTQYLEEADRLADRIAVLDQGRIVAEGTATELKHSIGGHRLDITFADRTELDRATSQLADRALLVDPAGRRLEVACEPAAAAVRQLLDQLDPNQTAIERFAVRSASLDDVFLALTGTKPSTDIEPHRGVAPCLT